LRESPFAYACRLGEPMLQLPSRAGSNLERTICAAALLVIIAAGAPARAGTILELSIGSGGAFNYGAGEHHPRFWAGGIRVGELVSGAEVVPILRGRLAFSSGTFLHSGGGNFFWGSGGSLSFNGCADFNHDRKCDGGDFKGTLMTGKFLNTELIQRNGKEILEAEIVDQLNPQLAALLHLPSTTYTGRLELTLAQLRSGRWWVRDKVQSGSLQDYGTVPEPSSIWLLGASLACWAGARFATAVGKDA
jgi:hypothetical protein